MFAMRGLLQQDLNRQVPIRSDEERSFETAPSRTWEAILLAELAERADLVSEQERVKDPALIVVDMQNDFVRVGAPLEVPEARGTIREVQTLLEAFRERGRPVIFTRFLAEREPGLMWLWSPQCRPDTKCCWPDHERSYGDSNAPLECADIISELKPREDEIIIDKFGYGAFHGTDLADRLRALDVSSLIIAGTVTQICVEETAREAFHHGFRTTIVSDAVSSYAPDLHNATLKNFGLKFGWVADTRTVLSWT